MTPKSICLCAVVLTGVFASSSGAFAQTTTNPQDPTAALLSTSSTSTTTIVGGVILTIVLSSGNSNLQQYLRKNRVALRDEITHGGGPTVADLADAFRVQEGDLGEFGTMLRTHRKSLLDLIGDDLDAESARRFIELVLQYGHDHRVVDRNRFASG